MTKLINNSVANQIRSLLFYKQVNVLFIRNNGMDKTKSISASIVDKEIRHFEKLASDWWDLSGPAIGLHALNKIRVPFIRDGLISTGLSNKNLINTSSSLKGVKILEIGCGAGILTEQLARTHADVTGIDPGKELINVAIKHLNNNESIKNRIVYHNTTIEEFSAENPCKYDAVVLSEVIEHIIKKQDFVECCLKSLKPGGSIFITTFDKTWISYMYAIIFGEKLSNAIPPGTHDWDYFISPLEMQRLLEEFNCKTILVNGFLIDVWRHKFYWIPTTKFSYALQAVKY